MSESAPLIRYDAMCRAIAEAYEVDEVKEIRNRAIAYEAYFRQAKNPEPERKACEIRLRAERRAGQLLAQMEKAEGAREAGTNRGTTRSPNGTASTLSDLGVSKKQSSRWQQLAAVSQEDFEAALAQPEKPSTRGIIEKSRPKQEPMDPKALWLWGRLRDFEREMLQADANTLLSKMTEGMQADVLRLAPLVADWLGGINDE